MNSDLYFDNNIPQINFESLDNDLQFESVQTVIGGGDINYNDLPNKPSINGVELVGNKTTEDLGIEAGKEVYIGIDEPSGEEVIWIDPNGEADVIPTKTSQLVNDSGFITEIPNEYAKKTDIPDVSNFITKDVNDLTNYYDKESISALVGNIEELLGGI